MEKNSPHLSNKEESAATRPAADGPERVPLFSQEPSGKPPQRFSLFGFLADLFTGRARALETSLRLAALVSFVLSPASLLYGLVGLLSRMLTGYSFLRSLHSFAGVLGAALAFLLLALFLLSTQKVVSLLEELKNNQKK